MTIYFTGRGDGGRSQMGKNMLRKDDALFNVLGDFDELNCWLGLCRTESAKHKKTKSLSPIIRQLQEILFVAQAEVGTIGLKRQPTTILKNSHTQQLENWIDVVNKKTPKLQKFIIPGASSLSARLDLARAVARRTERALVGYSKKQKVSADMLQFFNRLSSLLFALGRMANVYLGVKEDHPLYK